MSGGGAAGRRGSLKRWADFVDDEREEHVVQIDNDPIWASKAAWEADIEHWSSHYSEELATAWHALKEHCDGQGLPFLESASFPVFVEFMFSNSSKRISV